jgi:hypothetical protein
LKRTSDDLVRFFFRLQLKIATGTTTLLVPGGAGALTSGLQVEGYPYGLIQLR